MKKIAQNGYVLWIVLIFLLIFSLMALESLATVQELLKLISLKIKRDELLWHAESHHRRIERELMLKNPTCMAPIMSISQFVKAPIAWWQQHGCQRFFQGRQYYYVVESLGKDSCGIIRKTSYNGNAMIRYMRVTSMVVNQTSLNVILLQSTLAKESESNEGYSPCPYQRHVVQVGRQMLREG